MDARKYDQHVRRHNRRTLTGPRTNRRWTPAEDARLALEWPRDTRVRWQVDVALQLDRTLVACMRRVTWLRSQGKMPRPRA